ncbi:MAG: hypothetical protein R2719_03930 [Micropruina sp.]
MSGWSSGGNLALNAAQTGVPLARIALFEPNAAVDDTRPPLPADYVQRRRRGRRGPSRRRRRPVHDRGRHDAGRHGRGHARRGLVGRAWKPSRRPSPTTDARVGDALSGKPLRPDLWNRGRPCPRDARRGHPGPAMAAGARAIAAHLPTATLAGNGQEHSTTLAVLAAALRGFVEENADVDDRGATEFISIDGVVEAPGGEDFKYPDWSFGTRPWTRSRKVQGARGAGSAALLSTHHLRGVRAGVAAVRGELADKYNNMPKYVVSRTLTDPEWANTTVLSGDLSTRCPGSSGDRRRDLGRRQHPARSSPARSIWSTRSTSWSRRSSGHGRTSGRPRRTRALWTLTEATIYGDSTGHQLPPKATPRGARARSAAGNAARPWVRGLQPLDPGKAYRMLATIVLIIGLVLNALVAGLYFAFTTAVARPGLH